MQMKCEWERGQTKKIRANTQLGDVRINHISSKSVNIWKKSPHIWCSKNLYIDFSRKNEWVNITLENIGPVKYPFADVIGFVTDGNATNMRNLIFSTYVYPNNLTNRGVLKSDWFVESKDIAGTYKPYAKHPKGNVDKFGIHNEPLYCYYNGKKLSLQKFLRTYISQIYANYVKTTLEYKNLERLIKLGTDIYILGNDGYDFTEDGLSFKEYYQDENEPWGIPHILYGMLSGQELWNSVKSSK